MTTILIVEDDPINARIFSKAIAKYGNFNVQNTENVNEVMEMVASKRANLVLMDVTLTNSQYEGKVVNGIEMTRMIKANSPAFPIILVTACAMQGDRERFLQASGADEYIAKPVIDYQDFIHRIKSLLL